MKTREVLYREAPPPARREWAQSARATAGLGKQTRAGSVGGGAGWGALAAAMN